MKSRFIKFFYHKKRRVVIDEPLKLVNTFSRNIKRPPTGFTLIETFVAILILTAAIVGPMSIAQKGLQSAALAKDSVTAAYLAQDAIEYIRFIRESNYYGGQNWLYNFAGVCQSADQYCIIDTTDSQVNAIQQCVGSAEGSCDSLGPLRLDSAGPSPTYKYGYDSSWQPTRFYREIRVIGQSVGQEDAVNPSFPNAEALIDVRVQWSQGLITRNYYLRSTVMNSRAGF